MEGIGLGIHYLYASQLHVLASFLNPTEQLRQVYDRMEAQHYRQMTRPEPMQLMEQHCVDYATCCSLGFINHAA